MAELIDFLGFEARVCYKETLIMFRNADRALIFSQLLWWHKNSPPRCLLKVNGEVWVAKSYAEMAIAFPHLGVRTIRRHVDKLVELKVLKQTSLGIGETGKKNSYTPNPEGVAELYRQTLDPSFKPVQEEDSQPVQSLNKANLATFQNSNTNEANLAKVMGSICPHSLYIRLYNIYMTYNLKSAQIKSNCYGDFDFEFWWKFYHLMFKGVVSSRKAESKKKWNRLTPDERTKVIVYSCVEWNLKQAEYDCSGRDPAYKLASTFLNISVINFKEGMEMFDDLEQLSSDLTTKLVNLENSGLSRARLLAWQAHAKINPNAIEAVNGIKSRRNNTENGYWRKAVTDNPLQLDDSSKLLTQ
jgi:hypothetical protein